MFEIPDLDIDVKDKDAVFSLFPNATVGSILDQKRKIMSKHNNGVYFQNIPSDPESGLATFPYNMAEDFGYYKIDLLPNHVYDLVVDEDDMVELLAKPVDWSWFQNPKFFVESPMDDTLILTHIGKYLWLCKLYPPKSIEDISVLIAVIRPRKYYLIKERKSWEYIKSVIWKKLDSEDDKHYHFKKSHAVAFAMLVTLHAQIISWEIENNG